MHKDITADGSFNPELIYDPRLPKQIDEPTFYFRTFKTVFDKSLALASLPIILGFAAVLILINPLVNPGPLFFRQERMGMGGHVFRMIKFRTMLPLDTGPSIRRFDAVLEVNRITVLGRFLRRSRIDEFPNFLNVLRGEMSVIGPRPDALAHSLAYSGTIPRYADRFRVRPGITGLAQVHNGYADTLRSVERKARLDYFYIRKSCFLLDLYIIRKTIRVMLTGSGAR